MDKEKLEMAINACLDQINDENLPEDEKVTQVQKLMSLSTVENERMTAESNIRKNEQEIRVKRTDVWGRIGLGAVSVFGSLGVMGMIKEIEENSTVSSRMFPIALQNIQKVFKL